MPTLTPHSLPDGPASRTPSRVVSGTPKGRHERLYARSLGLVGRVLVRFPFLTGEAREEAYAAGLLGLWDACGRFDPARGFAFSTYACDTIRGHVLHHLKRQRRQALIPCVSLETPLGANGSELADVIADPQAEAPGAALLDQAGFEARLSGLPPRQQEVLRAVYRDEKPLAVIAEGLGVTKQRAGQIHLKALAALRKALGEQARGAA